ncbi:MAG: C/D box methylation guide ribonucleoprotein complex aNOP56 subunit [Thermoprotei archaeon]|nr:C/D box methylation guide ribonucleoprotein complex aNOP56 subunit [Thermoprotei archaeon]
MKVYIAVAPFGVIAMDEGGNVVDYEFFPKSVDDAVEEALAVEMGEVSEAFMRLAERLKGRVSSVVVEDDDLARSLSKLGFETSVSYSDPVFRSLRARLSDLAVSLGFAPSRDDLLSWMYDVEVEYTRRKLRGAAAKRDQLAIQAIRAIDDIDKTINLFATRVREWYAVHFPELDELVREHEEFLRIAADLGHRDNISVEALLKLGFSEGKASKIAEAASASIGADLSESDAEALRTLAGIVLELYELRSTLTTYIDDVMKEVAPNITALVGPLLGARLLSLAGSLEKMAKLPASTIQVLGAEKALFRALRTGGRPPKHGVIFQYTEIHKSPKWQRGKIARALAAKLSMAAKIDAFTGRYMGDKLNEDLKARIEEIKKVYAKPPVKEAKPKPPTPARREFRRGRRPRR